MKIWLGEHLLHLGWALFGQESDCQYNCFNWLACRIGEGQWTDDGEPANWRTYFKYHAGHWLVITASRLMA